MLVIDRPKLLTPAEIAKELRISLRTVYRMIDSGQLEAIRIGDQYRIKAESLDRLLNPPAD